MSPTAWLPGGCQWCRRRGGGGPPGGPPTRMPPPPPPGSALTCPGESNQDTALSYRCAAGTAASAAVSASATVTCRQADSHVNVKMCSRNTSQPTRPKRPWTFTFYGLSSHLLSVLLIQSLFLLTYAQGNGHGMVPLDEKVSFNVTEEQDSGAYVGTIPTRAGLQYKFSNIPRQFSLDPTSGVIRTKVLIDREALAKDTFDLFVQSTPSARHLIEVRIVVLDVNDNSPVFGQPIIEISYSEQDQPGTQSILDTATDSDIGLFDVAHDYRIISGNEENRFRLVLLTETSKPFLYLENTVELDREQQDFYQLKISVHDGGNPPKAGYLTVNITVLDFNDNHPVFDQSFYSVELNETAPTNTPIIKVHATDQDLGPNGDITYSIVNDDDNQFGVDPKTGIITTLKKLSCYRSCSPSIVNCKPKSCFVSVEARDNGRPYPLSGRAYVTVELKDENDHDPVIQFQYSPSDAPHATVDEGARENSVVALVTVTDQDDGFNGKTFVRITKGNELGHFKLDNNPLSFALLKVIGTVDREKLSRYNLTIVAQDLGQPPRRSIAFLIIMVNDINDHRPVFTQSSYHVDVRELIPVGSYIISVTAADNDTGLNADISYFILSGNDLGWFHIEASTGLITTQKALNRESRARVQLTIQAKDGATRPYATRTNLTITILDENDETPEFTRSIYNTSLTEGVGDGTEVVTVSATDNDEGINGTVRYFFATDTAKEYPGLLRLDSITGRITLVRELDREEFQEVILVVEAKDSGTAIQLTSTATIYVHINDVNDNKPIFYPQKYYETVKENMPAYTTVVRVTATDKDADDIIQYAITAGSDQKFSINIATGWISTQTGLDREQKALYKLTVVARDSSQIQSEISAEVEIVVADIQDSPPIFTLPNGYSFEIMEDDSRAASRRGRLVGQVHATTDDLQSVLTYTISGGDHNNIFTIDERNGQLTTAKTLDREEQGFYSLRVTALGGLAFAETTVNVSVNDINDNQPKFTSTSIAAFVVENWPVGHSVYVSKAEDPDLADNGLLEYSLSPESSNVFSINSATGMIQLAKALQYVNDVEFNVRVVARDGGTPSLFATQDVHVTIRDVNDHTPTFSTSTYEIAISEAQPVNDRFFRLTANDADTGLNGEVTYKIIRGNNEKTFGIFPDGVLYIAHTLDREVRDRFTLTVRASDHGVESRQSYANVTIHIIDSNDNAPIFINDTYNFYLMEGSSIGSMVGTVSAMDVDLGPNAEVTYKIEGKSPPVKIHPKTGVLTSKSVFDREGLMQTTGSDSFIVTVVASDSGNPSLRSKLPVTIYVSDANDNAPEFTQSVYEASLLEDQHVRTPVIKVSATDRDTGNNAQLTYEISNGNIGGKFTVDDTTGQVMLDSPLDRETRDFYQLEVMALDSGIPSLNTTATVKISVQDANDNRPQFMDDQTEVEVLETADPGTLIAQVRAVDADFGINSLISYDIVGGNTGAAFHVDTNVGKLSVAAQLDYEKKNVYHLNISATDSGDPEMHSFLILTVNILDYNDNAPLFLPSGSAIVKQIPENTPITSSVMQVQAVDPDEGVNGDVEYSIIKQDPSGHHFVIDSMTGVISVASALDREFSSSFQLTIRAKDKAVPPSSRKSVHKAVTVILEDMNDNRPEFVSMNAVAIMLGAQDGSLITQVRAVDPDEGENGRVQYSIYGGDTTLFRIEQATGRLYLKALLNSQVLTYDLTINAQDQSVSKRKSTLFRLTLFARSSLENGPTFSQSSYSGQVAENESSATSIVTVTASYTSRPTALVEYYLTRITSKGQDQPRLFQVNPTTGVVSTTKPLDRELGQEIFELVVYAVDRSATEARASSVMVQVTLVDRNDSPPRFASDAFEFHVPEDALPGHVISTLVAQDADTLGHVTYSVQDGGNGKVTIGRETGALSVLHPLDRETSPSLTLLVVADDGVQNSTTTVTLLIDDINDEKPVFSQPWYYFDVDEDTPTGVRVGQVAAVDADEGRNAEVSYSILSHWGRDKMLLHPHTGIITLIGRLDYEEVDHYVVTVKAQDNGASIKSSTVSVFINVIDTNDNAPIFDPSTYSIEVMENATIGDIIMTVSATDIDSGLFGELQYSIVSGDSSGHFRIDPATGDLQVSGALDRERYPHYHLEIRASDSGSQTTNRLSATAVVNIILLDINDNAPQFESSSVITVPENTPVGASVYRVFASDQDEGRNSYIEYSLPGTSDFSLGAVDGVLRVRRSFDRETTTSVSIRILAKDRGQPVLTTEIQMTVLIGDVNDHDPVFEPQLYSGNVDENVKPGTNLVRVTASDADDGLNAEIRFSITEGDNNNDFYIDPITGDVSVQKHLDYEWKQEYLLKVIARDLGDPARSDTASVTITVNDINDYVPLFVDSPYVAYVQENVVAASLPVLVLQVSAKDEDTAYFGRLSYGIKEGGLDLFSINSTSGEIWAHRTLDREKKDTYKLVVAATDSGSPRLTGTGAVTVLVGDDNDNAPQFHHAHYAARVPEDATRGTRVTTVTATDTDSGKNAQISFSLDKDGQKSFRIDQKSGEIFTRSSLDREKNELYELVVVATDSGSIPRSSSVSVTVTVEDVNDNLPHFSARNYVAYIRDPTPQDGFVIGMTAVDLDKGSNGHVRYSLFGGQDVINFNIDPDHGIVTAKRQLSQVLSGYTFRVRATDLGQNPMSDEVHVEVRFFPASTTAFPAFSPLATNSFQLQENTDSGHILTTVSASSPNPAAQLGYHIVGGDSNNAFAMSNTGVISLKKKLDFEEYQSYTLWIEASDGNTPPLTDHVHLSVTVIDMNDNVPVFDQLYYNVSVMEGNARQHELLTVSANDADSGGNSEVAYHIEGGNERQFFEVASTTGVVRTRTSLDREMQRNYQLVITAVDHGTESNTATATVDISVQDRNDNPPVFTEIFSAGIPENAPSGSFVIRITSTDADIGGNAVHTYSLSSNPGSKFAIDQSSGNITVAGNVDRETKDSYMLKVAAIDGSYRSETTVEISILDTNDNSPVFDKSKYAFTVVEGVSANTPIATIHATDRDAAGPNSEIYYRLKDSSEFFRINSQTGELASRQVFEYQDPKVSRMADNTHHVKVVAIDNGHPTMSGTVVVSILVKPANKHAPQFSQATYIAPVSEQAVTGQTIIQLSASDADVEGENAAITYRLVGPQSGAQVLLNSNTGVMTLAKSVQGQAGTIHNVTVEAVDGGTPAKTSQATISIPVAEVNYYSPRFSGTDSNFKVTLPENKPVKSVIARVAASDSDQGQNGLVSFYITGGDPLSMFSIDESGGYLRLEKPLDYETTKIHYLDVTARDRGLVPRETTKRFTITLTDVNDNPPYYGKKEYVTHIAENSPSGTVVFSEIALDKDLPPNTAMEYSIIGDGLAIEMFNIGKKTGIVHSQGQIDYEYMQQYMLKIKAANPHTPLSGFTSVKVIVDGRNEFVPQFTQAEYRFVVSESAAPGYKVGTLSATDEDAGPDGDIFYNLIGDSNMKGFVIDELTGTISIQSSIDREATAEIVLEVLAKNHGPIHGNDTSICIIRISVRDANDAPQFTQSVYEATVKEDADRDSTVTKVSAVDNDLQPGDSQFSYTILRGNDDRKFRIDHQTGQLYCLGSLDREDTPVYEVQVGAVDVGTPPKTGTATVRVTVTDVNDEKPYFDPALPTGYITENKNAYTEVVINLNTFTHDRDLPPNQGPYSYRLLDHLDVFDTSEKIGTVKARTMLDREVIPRYVLRVEVRDSGSPVQSSTLSFQVEVRDENDRPSTPRPLEVFVYAHKGRFPGGMIADVRPIDGDVIGNYQCDITSGDKTTFSIPQECNLHAAQSQDMARYQLHVGGSDGVHDLARYEVNVEFHRLEQEAVDHSIIIKLTGIIASEFLRNKFDQFATALSSLMQGNQVILFALVQSDDDLSVFVAVSESSQYVSTSVITENLQNGKAQIQGAVGVSIKSINANPCEEEAICQNGGDCSHEVVLGDSTHVIDSPTRVFTSVDISQQVQCVCQRGFTGARCETALNQCQENPCANAGVCLTMGVGSYRCDCATGWTGNSCSQDVDECSQAPCHNGGSCVNSVGSYICSCPQGYTGQDCKGTMGFDPCASSPCLNSGVCKKQRDSSYTCSCKPGDHGMNCQIKSMGFPKLSYAEYDINLSRQENSVSLEFTTQSDNALLFYTLVSDTEFLALELVDGHVQFSFILHPDDEVTRVTVPKRVEQGRWYSVEAVRKPQTASVSVADCPADAATCSLCVPGDTTCYATVSMATYTLWNAEKPVVHVGGLSARAFESVLSHPITHLSTHDFVGCMRHLVADKVDVFSKRPLVSDMTTDTCPIGGSTSCAVGACENQGTCELAWEKQHCNCLKGYVGDRCQQAVESYSLSPDTVVTYKQKEDFRRSSLLSQNARRRRRNTAGPHTVSLKFRTQDKEGLLYYSTDGKDFTSFYLSEGRLTYQSANNDVPATVTVDETVADGDWHSALLTIDGVSVMLQAGDAKMTKIFEAPVHDPLSINMKVMTLGGPPTSHPPPEGIPQNGFNGCVQDLEIDAAPLPLEGSTKRFEISQEGSVKYECTLAPIGPPVHVAIIVVVVFFVVILIIILVVFLVIRRRRRKKAAEQEVVPKQNGTLKSNGSVSDKNLESRSHQDSGFTENGELSEEAIIRQHVANELASYNEQDMDNSMPPAPDVVGMDVPTPGLRSGDVVIENGIFNSGYNDEPPEHYDIDNASSIAPSDVVDVSMHYRRYRKGMLDKNNKYPGYGHGYPPSYPHNPPLHPHQRSHSPASYLKSHDGMASRQSPASMSSHRSSPHNMMGMPSSHIGHPSKSPLTVNNLNRQSPMPGSHPQSYSPSPNIPTREKVRSPIQPSSLRSTPLSGISALYPPSNGSNSDTSFSERGPIPNGHAGGSRPGSRLRQPISQLGLRGTPTIGLSVDEINRLNTHHMNSPTSMLDAVSSSSDEPVQNQINKTDFTHADLMDPRSMIPPADSSSEESTNDSFTCSDIVFDNDRMRNDFSNPHRLAPRRLPKVSEDNDTDNTTLVKGRQSQGSDSNHNDSFSTFFTSEDESMPGEGRRSRLPPNALSLDYLLNWGPNFEKLVGVFTDIAQLPDSEPPPSRPPSRPSSRNSPKPKSPMPKPPTPIMPVILEDLSILGSRENGVHENGLENSFDSLKEEYV